MRWTMWLLAGCNGLGVVHGNGHLAEEERGLATFDGIENEINVDVSVVEGEPGATVSCDDNLVDLVQTEVAGGTLRVRTRSFTVLDPTVPCTVVVSATKLMTLSSTGSGNVAIDGTWPGLREISATGSGEVFASGRLEGLDTVSASGSGSVDVSGILAGFLDLATSGSGSLTLAGVADAAMLDVSGSGDIAARSLTVGDADVEVSGSGNVELTATGTVTADLSGSGELWLWGNPNIDADVSGSGDVHEQ